jgi:flagellar motor switch protein FliN/FliY
VRRQLPAIRPHVESPTPSTIGVGDLSRLAGFEVDVTLLLGRTEIMLEEVAKLDEQSLVTVDKRADEPVEVLINGELFAHGKLVMVGNHYGVQLLKLVGRPGDEPGYNAAPDLKGGSDSESLPPSFYRLIRASLRC